MLNLASNLKLPIESVTQTFAILARRGAGKTHTGSVLAEELLAAGYPVVIIDPIGVWWGLRSEYSIAIFGGEHADVPLQSTAGKTVADFVVKNRLPVILDVSAFGENEMRRFVADFAQHFYHINREPIHLIVDEADEFAPQDGAKGPRAACLGAMQNVVRRGRARGIGCTLITQRSAVLNKSVLTQTECLIAMQTTGPHDLKAIDEWVKYHGTATERDEIMRDLTKLQQGEAWVYSPGWLKILKRVKFRGRHSFDSSRTPKPGESRQGPKKLADLDIAKLTKEMAATIEQAKADDPKELKKKIAELERQIKARPAEKIPEPKIVEVQVLKNGQLDRTEKILSRVESQAEKLFCEAAELRRLIAPATAPRPTMKPAIATPKKIAVAPRAIPSREVGTIQAATDVNLGKAERAILVALYWLRNESTTPAKVGFYAGYSSGSGSFNNALGKLRSMGLLGGWAITTEGIAVTESCGVGDKPAGPALREMLRPKLGRAENALLDVLCEFYPQRMTADELGQKSGYSPGSGSFNNALGKLRTIEAIEGYQREGGPKASDVFFE